MAGTQVVDQIQLGNNGTAANNFVIKTMNDGTMKIQRGNIGGSLTDVLTIDVNGHVSCPVASVNPTDLSRRNETLGLDQTWQDVKASRVFGTTYTNSTGKPIQVIAQPTGSGVQLVITASINAGAAFNVGYCAVPSGVAQAIATLIIPPGATYLLTQTGGTNTPITWSELR